MVTATVDLTKADAAYAKGRFAEAETLYRDVLLQDTTNAAALEKAGNIALWKNDLPAAETYLQAARKHQSWCGRLWPLNVSVNAHLAQVYTRSDRMQEAATLFDSAAGFLPWGPFKEWKVRADQLKLFVENAPYRMSGEPESIIPFVVTDPLPVVQVSINSSGPVDFFIDTGGEGLIVDSLFANNMGAVIVGEVPGEYASAKKGMTGYGKADQVDIGGMRIGNVPISTLDLETVSQTVFPGLAIKGILGTGFLQRFLSTLDYRTGQLVLRQPVAAQQVEHALKLSARDHVFPMWLIETHLIFVEGSFNQREPGMMLIDTGLADAGFLTSKAILADAGITLDWRQATFGAGGGGMLKALAVPIDEVTLGREPQAIRRQKIKGVVCEEDISLFKDALGFKVGGLISHQFFKGYAVTFDFVNMRLILQQ